MSTAGQSHLPLGQFFLEKCKITEEELEAALAHKAEHNMKLGQALMELGLVEEADLMEALQSQGKIFCINLTNGVVDSEVALALGERESRRFRAVAINRIANHTTVAMEDPSDVYAIDELAMRLGTRILPVFSEPSKIEAAIEHVFLKEAVKLSGNQTSDSVDRLAQAAYTEEDPDGRPKLLGFDELSEGDDGDDESELTRPVINMVRSLLEDAFVQGVSDIHFEPRRDHLLIRFRIDGILFDRTTVPASWERKMIARIKVMANLDIAQRRLPQDGRMQFRYKGNRVDLRVATTPTLVGEGAVLRVLDGGRELHNLEQLDLDARQLETLERTIECREGFVLATGPTGSGKTTTLYAILQRLNSPDRKIITLEDPVENEMVGITQINANPKIGMTFARGLRSILRQDPDIVLVGEIRDHETAEIAVQASLTGHIVMSTLHTVGAAESITRLADMGVEPYLLGDTLRGIISQRLVRRVCSHCRTIVRPDASFYRRLGLEEDGTPFYEGRGCDECHETGFKGRLGIYEIMQMTPELCRLVEQNAGTEAIHKAALEQGLITLREDGLRKARAGYTTLSEVLAATTRG